VFIGIEEIIGLGSKPNWDDEIDADKYRKAIASALKRLTARERMAFVLRMEEKYSTEEVAKVMNISKGTVKTLLHRAKEKMKKFLRTNLLDEFGSIKNE